MYTDGSKDRDNNLAGAGIVIFDETDSFIMRKGVSFDHRVSIHSCEISAINIVFEWLSNRSKEMFTSTNVTIFTDSLSTLVFNIRKVPHTTRNSESDSKMYQSISQIWYIGDICMDSELCWYYRKRDSGSDG